MQLCHDQGSHPHLVCEYWDLILADALVRHKVRSAGAPLGEMLSYGSQNQMYLG
jgi:hypothetical protein